MTEDPITERIIGCAYKVANALGPGFLEKVYENALLHELRKAGLAVQAQKSIEVWYEQVLVGDFVVDLLVEGRVLVELKATATLDRSHMAQALNYLAATGLRTCLLINFGTPKIQVRRLGRDRAGTVIQSLHHGNDPGKS